MFNPSDDDIADARTVKDGTAYGTHYDGSLYICYDWIEAAERLSKFVLACRDANAFFEKLRSGEAEVVQ